MNELSDLMKLDRPSLIKKASELKAEFVRMKFESSLSAMEKPHKFKNLKKKIAQCLTVYNSKAGK